MSDKPDICSSNKAGKVRAGEALVQIYHLVGTAPGKFTSEGVDGAEIKYARVKPTCTSGQPLADSDIDSASRMKTATIDVTTSTASSFVGTLTLAFEDGSTLTGSFDLAACTASELEEAVCE